MAGGELNISPEDKELLLRRIHSGEVNVFNLPVKVYRGIADELNQAIFTGFGLDFDSLDLSSPDFESIRQLQRNTYVFSAAKTFQQINDIQNVIFDSKGFTRPFRLFERDAAQIFDTYNKTWLKAEFETAKEASRAAKRWNEIQAKKDVFPFLQYRTRRDSRVRPEHAELDGIIRPVDDEFWDTHTPPNGWGCNNRCRLVKLEDAPQITPLKKVKLSPKDVPGDLAPEVWERGDRNVKGKPMRTQPNPKLFNLNFGKDKIIFPESSRGLGITSHPYFRVHRRFKNLKDNNFNMAIPTKIMKPAPVKVQTAKPVPKVAQRLKDVKARIKSITPIGERGLDDIDAKLDNQKAELNKLRLKANAIPFNSPERQAAVDAWTRQRDLLLGTVSERRAIIEAYEDEVTKALAQQDPAVIKASATDGVRKGVPRYQAGVEAFKQIVGARRGVQGKPVRAKIASGKKARAFYRSREKATYYSKSEKIDTITHEMAHWLEDVDRDYFRKIKEFYARRTAADQLERLTDLQPGRGYKRKEITKKDLFTDPYTGKWYARQDLQTATEITPMWFTNVYTDIHKFIREDPDHFETIFKLLNE